MIGPVLLIKSQPFEPRLESMSSDLFSALSAEWKN